MVIRISFQYGGFIIKFYGMHFPHFSLYIFNQRIIALQYWFDFCHTSTWISHKCAYTPPTSCPSKLLQSPVWVPWVIQNSVLLSPPPSPEFCTSYATGIEMTLTKFKLTFNFNLGLFGLLFNNFILFVYLFNLAFFRIGW